MAPTPVSRSRRPRGRGQQAAANPRDRLPVGTRASQDPNASLSHIQIVSRYDDEESQSGYEDDTPVHTNQSYLTEVDPGLDLHQRDSHLRQHSGQTTFADMARAGVGVPDHHTSFANDFMPSQEPQSLTNFVRFKKKRGRQWTPIDEESSSTRPSSPAETIIEQTSQPSRKVTQNTDDPTARKVNQNVIIMNTKHATDVSMNPVDALRAHMNNVKATFGRLLPDPSYLTANFGQRDREIQFVLHPNGDIHAHQWLSHSVEWQPVGQYIYGRKVLEGILSQEPLRGQKIGSFSPQNMLQRFIAVAKQYEEASLAKAEPKGYEPGTRTNFVRPAIPLASAHPQRPPLSMDPSNPMGRSFSSAGYSSQTGGGLPTLSNIPIRQPAPTRPRPPPVLREETYTIDTRPSSPVQTYHSAASPHNQRKQLTPEFNNYTISSRNSFGTLLPGRNLTDSAHSSFSGISGFKTGLQDRVQAQGMGRVAPRQMIREDEQSSDEAISPTTARNPLSTTIPERGSFLVGTEKTMVPPAVFKKPAQPNPFASWSSTNHKHANLSTQGVPLPKPKPSVLPGLASNHISYAAAYAHQGDFGRPASPVMSEPRYSLIHSEPEAGYSDRQCVVLTDSLKTAEMSNEELIMYSRPTEQQWCNKFWRGKYFTGWAEDDQRSDDEKTMEWWNSGALSKRKNWEDVHGTYSSQYAEPMTSVPHFSVPQYTRKQAPVGTPSATFGMRGRAVEYKGKAAREVATLGW